MKTAELSGAQLNYWTARADCIPAEELTIRRVQRSTDTHCVRVWTETLLSTARVVVLCYATDWAQGGPLLRKLPRVRLQDNEGAWAVQSFAEPGIPSYAYGDDPLQAICRAVVRAAFGDEVEEIATEENT